ncbi:dihydrofolate reductase family protein [Methylobacterium sp. Leaf466]|uniref:dihydrofolate reductase family protein n=1 Tax=Methylobacterium sp. Leaf466 TaxID=1736386 RepID=UPI0006F21424|nr:dihydrofolate reductase family protein [Methylobacterium sp. Leaf466]KQT82979.1 5-amino-6-(5-phosphoribosylamino)uracil reductase [Methylobacterium sp. Leaf466]
MGSSIDGRLHPSRWTPAAAGIQGGLVHRHYEETAVRLDAQGWIVGRTTMAEIAKGVPQTPACVPGDLRGTHVGARKGRDLAVAIDPHGKVHYGRDDVGGDHVVAVLGEDVPDAYLAELREDGVSYLFAGRDGRDLAGAMATLGATFGVETLLLEGGGIINGAFLKAGLIDEVSLLVSPAVDGLAGVPTIFEYHGEPNERPAAGKALRHFHTETLEGGTVWLRYRVEDAEPVTG